MNHPFVQYLTERDLVPTSVAKRLLEKKNYVREPIGMIAVGHGLLNSQNIDTVLDRQRETKERFGDIAVELGFLTREQVETLLKIQDFRAATVIAEALALAGVISCDDAVCYLGGYLVHDREVLSMMSDS